MMFKNKRLIYFALFLGLTAIEVLIALFVHDRIIRPYGGDALVVIVIYCFVRIFIPVRYRLLPLWVFLFAIGVEVLQFFHYLELLGLQNNRFATVLLGTSFSWIDILSYAIGCALLGVFELFVLHRRKSSTAAIAE